uniref:Uncharacterized protein n=1 Tax=Nothobranchius kuhntae TaxID=321403 RepID=A0A1A8JMR7_NOTKU
MGNILQCCRALSDYFKHPDASAGGGSEQSRLLSSEESECDSWSLTFNLEDDLFTISTGVTRPTLQPDHFLFPDIILSSSPGEEVTLVEPMVCLLVSEEEEALGDNDIGGEDVRRDREIQTQTDARRQTLQSNKKEKDETEGGQRVLEANEDPQTSQDGESELETENKIKKSVKLDIFIEENTLNKIKTTSTQLQHNRERQEDSGVFEMEQHPESILKEQNKTSMDENITLETQKTVKHKKSNPGFQMYPVES